MKFKNLVAWLAALVVAVGIGSASATPLVGRDINRNAVAANDASAVYLWDQDLGVTWLRNANINGASDWSTQDNYAQNLVTGAGVNAISDWRLPTVTDYDNNGCTPFTYAGGAGTDCGYNVDTGGSEMAHLFYVTLGNLSLCNPASSTVNTCDSQAGFGLTKVGDFLNMQSDRYWSGTVYAPENAPWAFGFEIGAQFYDGKGHEYYAMAVRPGDVLAAQVPEPESLVLALTALAVLGLLRRRRAILALA